MESIVDAKGYFDSSELLDLAFNLPFQTFENTELYPSIQSKAARLCFSLISNHSFIDGNNELDHKL